MVIVLLVVLSAKLWLPYLCVSTHVAGTSHSVCLSSLLRSQTLVAAVSPELAASSGRVQGGVLQEGVERQPGSVI